MSNNSSSNQYTHRRLARVVVEAVTPLAVGQGEGDIMTDALVCVDVNGLPTIPASTIAGVMRHLAEDNQQLGSGAVKSLFGFQIQKTGEGSRLVLTEARLLDEKGRVLDSILAARQRETPFLEHYQQLPIRQHVRIDHRGVADKGGKFDQQIVPAGSRFCFELELLSKADEGEAFHALLALLHRPDFRLGRNTRSGLGQLRVVELHTAELNMQQAAERTAYLNKPSRLDEPWEQWRIAAQEAICNEQEVDGYRHFHLTLRPDDFFLFASGMGDEEADITPVTEARVEWNPQGQAAWSDALLLIPATSVKGAVAHRVAYHDFRERKVFADHNPEADLAQLSRENAAMCALFGSEDAACPLRGCVLMSDLFGKKIKKQLFQHVAIDRFTGGKLDGALFAEQVADGRGDVYEMNFWVDRAALRYNIAQLGGEELTEEDVLHSFELALQDLCNGLLLLGGASSRGHGRFTGILTIMD